MQAILTKLLNADQIRQLLSNSIDENTLELEEEDYDFVNTTIIGISYELAEGI